MIAWLLLHAKQEAVETWLMSALTTKNKLTWRTLSFALRHYSQLNPHVCLSLSFPALQFESTPSFPLKTYVINGIENTQTTCTYNFVSSNNKNVYEMWFLEMVRQLRHKI